MADKYPEGLLDKFVTSSSLTMQKTGFGGDKDFKVQVQREIKDSPHSDDYFYWMYYSSCDPHYHGYYYTPSLQSSAPTGTGGSSGDGGDGGDSGEGQADGGGGDGEAGGDFGCGDFGDGRDGGDGGDAGGGG